MAKDGKLTEYVFEGTRTLYDCFQRGMRVSGELNCLKVVQLSIVILLIGDGDCLGVRDPPGGPYKFIKYSEVRICVFKL